MKTLRIMMILTLPVVLGGCPMGTNYPDDPYESQSLTRAQIEQTTIQMKQRQKISQKNQSQTINIYNQNQPYSGYPEMLYNADRLAQAKANRREYMRRMEEARQREQALQNSYAAARADQVRRQGIAAQEARDIEQAKQNSYTTAREEEARQVEQAKQESLRTFAQEEARRQQASIAALPAVSVSPPPPPPPPPSAVSGPVAPPIPASEPKWKPSGNDLVQAGSQVIELKNKNEGKIPSHGEMSSHIQSNMGLSSDQADKVLGKLGL